MSLFTSNIPMIINNYSIMKDVSAQNIDLSQNMNISGFSIIGGTLDVSGITTIKSLLNANGGITCDTNNFIVSGTNGDTSTRGKLSVGTSTLCTDVGLNNQTLANTNSKSMIFGRNNNFIGTNISQARIIFGYANDISGNADDNIIFGMGNKINNVDGSTIFGKNCVVNNAGSCALGFGAITTASFQTIIGTTNYSQALRLQGGLGYINSDNLIVTTNASGVTNISGLVSLNSSVSTQKAYRTYLSDAETFYVQMNGEIWAQAVTTYSDSRIKHNQEPLHGLEVIRTLKPTKYNKTNTQENNDSFEEAGFIAQEVLDTKIGWVVHTSNTQEQYYGLNYNSIFTYGIQAIKELDEQLHMEKEKTKQLQQQLQKTNELLEKARMDIEKSKFEIQYIKNILEIV